MRERRGRSPVTHSASNPFSHQRDLHVAGADRSGESALSDEDRFTARRCGGIPLRQLDRLARSLTRRKFFAAQFREGRRRLGEGCCPNYKKAVDKSPDRTPGGSPSGFVFLRKPPVSVFLSVANQTRFVVTRDRVGPIPTARSLQRKRSRLRKDIRRLLESEIVLAKRPVHAKRGRIHGSVFEPSCQYFYLPLDLVEKVVNCRWLLSEYEGE